MTVMGSLQLCWNCKKTKRRLVCPSCKHSLTVNNNCIALYFSLNNVLLVSNSIYYALKGWLEIGRVTFCPFLVGEIQLMATQEGIAL